jgi:hypothetical protein
VHAALRHVCLQRCNSLHSAEVMGQGSESTHSCLQLTAWAVAVGAGPPGVSEPPLCSLYTHLDQTELLMQQAAPSRQAVAPHLLMVAPSQLQASKVATRAAGHALRCWPRSELQCVLQLGWAFATETYADVMCGVQGTHLVEVLLLLLPPGNVLQPAQPGCSHTPLPAHGSNHVLHAGIAPALLTPLRSGSSTPCSRLFCVDTGLNLLLFPL